MDLEQARQEVNEKIKEGTDCPCCGQYCKLYKRNLDASMVRPLIAIYRHHRQTGKMWTHAYEDVRIHGGDYAKLRHWGLLQPKGDEPVDDKKSSGYWRVTSKGEKFLLGQIEVPKFVFLFNNIKRGEAEKTVDVKTALTKKFSYAELMGEYLPEPYQVKRDWSKKQMQVRQTGEGKDVKIFEVIGAHDKKYTVEMHHGAFGKCTCEGYRFSTKKTCKHCVEVLKFIKREQAGIADEAQQKLL